MAYHSIKFLCEKKNNKKWNSKWNIYIQSERKLFVCNSLATQKQCVAANECYSVMESRNKTTKITLLYIYGLTTTK